MVTSSTGKGIIVMGGYSSRGRSKAMFELSQSMEWTRLEQTLQIGHKAPLAIPIPDELVYDAIMKRINAFTDVLKNEKNSIICPLCNKMILTFKFKWHVIEEH